MGVVNTKSTVVTNADASPRVANDSRIDSGVVRCSTGTVEVAAADSDTSVYRFVRLPSNAIIHKIEIYNDAITGGTAYECGIHKNAADGGAVVDADVFATTLDLSSAHATPLDIAFEAYDFANCEKKLWEQLGLSADSFLQYDLTMTGTTVGTAAGTITVKVYWSM